VLKVEHRAILTCDSIYWYVWKGDVDVCALMGNEIVQMYLKMRRSGSGSSTTAGTAEML
jgi:hypothetical protein